MKHELISRNKEIAISVINGGTFSSVAENYGISKQQAHSVFCKMVRGVLAAANYKGAFPELKEIRGHREWFVKSIVSLDLRSNTHRPRS